jgi:chaperone required for assembly of F1-ATPase
LRWSYGKETDVDGGRTKPGAEGRRLQRRGYTSVAVEAVPHEANGRTGGRSPAAVAATPRSFRLLLDGKPLLTPAKRTFAVNTRALAEAIAGEWSAQGDCIDPKSMPLTRLANSAIDGVRGRERAVRGDIAKYAASDLLCYRADRPDALVRLQREAWDGVLAWARETLEVRLRTGAGLMPIAQPADAAPAVANALEHLDCFGLAAMHVITSLTGSVLLALALAHGQITARRAWEAAHVDEEFQISQWGADAEAAARQQRRGIEMQAASRMLELIVKS